MSRIEELIEEIEEEKSDPLREDPFFEDLESRVVEVLNKRLRSIEEKIDQIIENQNSDN